jgi:pyruvate ferredoxin oxidoreductase beta subunit
MAIQAAGPNVIVAQATGCLEITTSKYPQSAWRVPWIHSLFENTASVASGIEAALRMMGGLDGVKVIAQGGDGAFADIGFGALSGLWERGDSVVSICYDNEAYMNTGIQRSGLTPTLAHTSTTPAGSRALGNRRPKKDMIALALAHGLPYVTSATPAYPRDLERKVKRALSVDGPSYIHLHSPCPLGWGFDAAKTIEVAKLAVQTGLFPVVEFVDGEPVNWTRVVRPEPVERYLGFQRRFRHILEPRNEEALAQIQAIADRNIRRYRLAENPPK